MNNTKNAADIELTIMGGLCTEMAPSDLPQGASPLTYDTDYDVGRTRTRDGLKSVYAFSGESQGPSGGGAAADVPVAGGVAWGSPTNVLLDDGSYATAAFTGVSGTTRTATVGNSGLGGPAWSNPGNVGSPTSYATNPLTNSTFLGISSATLACTNYGFSAPAAVSGISMSFDAFISPAPVGVTPVVTVFLLQAGVIVGTAKSQNLTNTSVSTFSLGGSADLWSAFFSGSDVANSGFGVRLQVSFSHSTPPQTITVSIRNVQITVFSSGVQTSDFLDVKTFGFSIPAVSITGVQAAITGHQSVAGGIVTAQLLRAGVAVGNVKTLTPNLTTDTTILLGGMTDSWGLTLSPADINNSNFGLQLQATSSGMVTTISLDFASLTIYESVGLENFHWIKTFLQDNGEDWTLALDAAGILWKEDVNNSPNVLTVYAENILPGSFAKSCTEEDEEWIAFSNLLAGTDIPRHGSNLDRISQVGPGAGPAIIGSAAGTNSYAIVASPNGLTQPPAASDPDSSGHFNILLWSDGPFSRAPGNVLSVFYSKITHPPDPNIVQGGGVTLASLSGAFSTLNGTYVVQSVGQGFPPGGASQRNYFTVVVATVGNQYNSTTDNATGTYQVTLATMTTTDPAIFQVGDSVAIASATAPAWDGTWTILATLNGAQIAITSTALTSNVATYTYTLISGIAPSTGQQVSIAGCTNGPVINGTSIFNVQNQAIATAGVGTFTVALNSGNVTSAAETGNGVVNGTIFQFDPGFDNLGAGSSGIFGNSGGGTASTTGDLGAGIRQAVTIFETRNGFLTAPSPPVIFETTGSASTLQVSQIAIGPPNVIRRWVGFTAANGGNFFLIPQAVTVVSLGQSITYTATSVNDNVTTSATFRFTDAVLLAGSAIDTQGNNLFNQVELGAAAWDIAYAGRMFYGLENNKIQNLLNPTFDGGYLPIPGNASYPLGWTVDPVYGGGGALVPSPIFGNSYYIQNATGSTQTYLGLITQPAYQDFYKVPIILTNFTYSARITARAPSGITTGNLIVDLYSPSLFRQFGNFTIPFASLSTVMQIFTGTLLTSAFLTQVPTDLQLRVYAAGIANEGDVEIDRVEPFPTLQPTLTTELQGSYVQNLEAFDGVSGPLGVGFENNQPALGAFVNYDILYILKTGSLLSTQDSPGNEPADWTVREVSNKIGTCGIHAYDYGEEWMVTACRPGLYVFNGGEPIKISQENQPIWDAINWLYGDTIWVRNDIINRKIFVGVPLPTPNAWMPNAPTNANPTSPNVLLMLNYKELNTSNDLAERGPVKISYSGKLISWDMSRKWSLWQIPAPYADFVTRASTSAPLFFCNGSQTSKIYQQISGQLNDDGAIIDSLYTTYGFVKPDEEAQNPLLGAHRKLYKYLDMNLSIVGSCTLTALPNVLTPTYPYVLPGIPGNTTALASPAQNNVERPLNQTGSRLYMQLRSNTLNAGFSLSELKMTAIKDPHAPVRGLA